MMLHGRVAQRTRNGVYGLLGAGLSQSSSPLIFGRVFDGLGWPAVYALYDLPARQLDRFLGGCRDFGIVGLNVTMPYKRRVIDFLDRLDGTAAAVGAVNTIAVRRGALIGYNTDVDGVVVSLRPHARYLRGKKALILGAGGVARAVAYALTHRLHMGHITVGVRSPSRARAFLREWGACRAAGALSVCSCDSAGLSAALNTASLIVNATPVGGGGLAARSPLPEGLRIPSHAVVFDVVYQPRTTRLLRRARSRGCERIIGGWPMLIAQAEASFRIWTGRGFPISVRRELLAG